MSEAESPEAALEAQKANCIFCKIVKGEQPSKVVYKDEVVEAILDIRPAVKGHTLVLPREHYPLMPLVPPPVFEQLFGQTAALSKALTDALLVQRCTTFIANGGVAGQQSPHFLFHLIPREEGDNLSCFTIPKNGVNQSDIHGLVKENLYAAMRQHLTQKGEAYLLQLGTVVEEEKSVGGGSQPVTPEPKRTIPGRPTAPPPTPTTTRTPPNETQHPTPHPQTAEAGEGAPQPQGLPTPTFEQLAQIIESNPDIKRVILEEPSRLKQILADNPSLQSLFAGVDIQQLSAQLRGENRPASTPDTSQPTTPTQTKPPTPPPAEASDDLRPARELTLQELFTFIDAKPKLRQLILQDPKRLKRIIPKNERLARFFAGSNLNAIIQAYQEHAKTHDGVHVTVEPEDETVSEEAPATKEEVDHGPSREEEASAYDEVWDDRRRSTLDKIGRLFR